MKKRKYWYYISTYECVLCGTVNTNKERRYTKKPKKASKRHNHKQDAHDAPFEVFNKFKLEILVENKKDLTYLWLLFNMGTESLEKAYEGDARNLQKVHALSDLDKSDIWQILDVAKMEEER